jgi:ABC-2 type transport system ATP-binding protein
MEILNCNKLVKIYNKKNKTNHGIFKLVVDEFNVKKGEIAVLLGQNGAGKTTLLKTILDLIRPDEGKISINGIDHRNKKSRGQVGFVPESFSFPGNWKTEKVIYYYGLMKELKGKRLREETNELAEALDIRNIENKKVNELSKGMLQSLLLLHALTGNNKLLILDEPFNGLDHIQKMRVIEYLNELKKQEVSMLVTTHILSDIEKIGDKVTLIDNGKIFESHSRAEITSKYKSVEKYYEAIIG